MARGPPRKSRLSAAQQVFFFKPIVLLLSQAEFCSVRSDRGGVTGTRRRSNVVYRALLPFIFPSKKSHSHFSRVQHRHGNSPTTNPSGLSLGQPQATEKATSSCLPPSRSLTHSPTRQTRQDTLCQSPKQQRPQVRRVPSLPLSNYLSSHFPIEIPPPSAASIIQQQLDPHCQEYSFPLQSCSHLCFPSPEKKRKNETRHFISSVVAGPQGRPCSLVRPNTC